MNAKEAIDRLLDCEADAAEGRLRATDEAEHRIKTAHKSADEYLRGVKEKLALDRHRRLDALELELERLSRESDARTDKQISQLTSSASELSDRLVGYLCDKFEALWL